MRAKRNQQMALPGMESDAVYARGYRAGRESARQELYDARKEIAELRDHIRSLTVALERQEWGIPSAG